MDGKVVAIEVKSGKIYKSHKALNNFCDNLTILVNNDYDVKEIVNIVRYSEKGGIDL